ncbi:MAG: glycosyltransferase family 4 protein [Actinomycetia bacterium]|nr:glycosyltransferase family 4 protein [Actinomycetes bacterium]
MTNDDDFPEASVLRSQVAGRRIGIVHYGEHNPLDEGYRPARMGQLAAWLNEAGAEVTRFVPTYSPFALKQRPQEWTGQVTTEGTIHMIPTRAYASSKSRARFGFLRDFAKGSASAVASRSPFDLLISGYPPPGVILALRRAVGRQVPILADIRDLWPDVLFVAPSATVARATAITGDALAQELRLATGAVAMSNTMVERAPRNRRWDPVTHSISESLRSVPISVDPDGPMTAVFVGTVKALKDFESLLAGWKQFGERRSPTVHEPVLQIFGSGDMEDFVRQQARLQGTIEFGGWVQASEIPKRLAAADVGVVPTRPGHGTTLNNKVLEYLGTGIYILNSLEVEAATQLDEQGFGTRVEASPEGWASGFLNFEKGLSGYRSARLDRQAQALARYGREGVEAQWLAHIVRAMDQAG